VPMKKACHDCISAVLGGQQYAYEDIFGLGNNPQNSGA
jgi:hypothetical protein